MEDEQAIITARSRQEAMEWALVLASQGIQSTVEPVAETSAWRLNIPAKQYFPARESIRLYLRENRNRRWRREWETTGLLFDGRAVFYFLFLNLLHGIVATGVDGVREAGRMDAAKVASGEWWRLLTATTLHADIPHLIANTTTGIILLGVAMGIYGAGPALLGSLLAGAMGNGLGLLLHDGTYRSLGASGMVMGSLGLLAAHSWLHNRELGGLKLAVRGLMGGVFILLLLGMDPRSDVVVHVGGFVGGILSGLLWVATPNRWRQKYATDWGTVLVCLVLLLVAWGFALRFG
ncbi:MAG: rhomboid family intramembrane serine protease [Verrucomicrobiota bacterium]